MATKNALLGQFGVYHLASLLCKAGYTAVTTSRNTEAADLLVYNHRNGKAIGIQVKTVRQQHKTDLDKDTFPVTTTTDGKIGTLHFWTPFVFIYIPKQERGDLRYFHVPGDDVAELLKKGWDDYKNNSKIKRRKPVEQLGQKPFLACLNMEQLRNGPYEFYPDDDESWTWLGLK